MAFDSIKPPCEKLETTAGCMQATLCVLGDKWTPLLLGQLVSGEKTFGELEIGLNGVSPRTLSARLEKLLDGDIIVKNQYNAHPPRYKYALSSKGKELQGILEDMVAWGEKHQGT